ncbi:MAG: hypothetical protein WD077_12480 [Bacteroidia bacterium]
MPYATLEAVDRTYGIATNADGKAKIVGDAKLLNQRFIVSSIGYTTDTVLLRTNPKNDTAKIFLAPKTYLLNEAVFLQSKESREILAGVISNRPAGYAGSYFQSALYFPNDNLRGQIISVSYFISSKGFPEAPFRVRIYASQADTVFPAEDILPVSLVVRAGKKGWFTVDVKEYQIAIPENGFFVSFEAISGKDEIYNDQGILGPTLGLSKKHPYRHNWIYYLKEGHGWSLSPPLADFDFHLNPMIRATLRVD